MNFNKRLYVGNGNQWTKSTKSFNLIPLLCKTEGYKCVWWHYIVLVAKFAKFHDRCNVLGCVWWVNDFAQNIRWLNYKQGIWLPVYFIKLLLPNFFLLPHPHGDSWKDLPFRGCPCLWGGGESLRKTEKQPTGSLDSCYCCCRIANLCFGQAHHGESEAGK